MKHILLLLLLLPLSSMAQRALKPSQVDENELYLYVRPTGLAGVIQGDSVFVALLIIKSTGEYVIAPLPMCYKEFTTGQPIKLLRPELPLP
jgi:hypothetical protein